MRNFLICFVFCLFCGIFEYGILYNRWKSFWSPANRLPYYNIPQMKSDTLRVLMIGDSWAEIHSLSHMDSFMQSNLGNHMRCPVLVSSKGIGGEKSRGVYQNMFKEGESGTKSMLLSGCDYCIISAGINDAASNLGTKQLCTNYCLIIDFLLANGIRPVIVEVPDVDIWNVYGGKPKKDLLCDYLRSIMTHCDMYNYSEYRKALLEMLQKEDLMQKVVYVPMKSWNGHQTTINKALFLKDGIHLNKVGYEKLDSCIASLIVYDLTRR